MKTCLFSLLVVLCSVTLLPAAKPAKRSRPRPKPTEAKTTETKPAEPKADPEPATDKPDGLAPEPPPTSRSEEHPVSVSSISTDELAGFDTYPPRVQSLIRTALALTTKNLRYQFGSSDPSSGGMDCSGTIYRVLQSEGFKETPRQSDEICGWLQKQTMLYRTEFPETFAAPAFSAIEPGDLVFWSGTYIPSSPRELPITHVMMYLGKRKSDGKPVLFGASDGRTYDGQRRNGVSVFDFHVPKRDAKSAIYGYGPVPGLSKN